MWIEGTHGPGCGSKTWPTSCRRCGARTYFFCCEHGSKVFFDDLGPPWPIHDCDGTWARGLRRTIDGSGRVSVDVAERVTVVRDPRRFRIEAELPAIRPRKLGEADHPIVRQFPTRRTNEAYLGVVRGIVRSSNPLAALKLDDTTIGRASLGCIGKQPVGRITIHVPAPEGTEIESYTAWIPQQFLNESEVIKGATVEVRLEGVQLLTGSVEWFCSGIEVLA